MNARIETVEIIEVGPPQADGLKFLKLVVTRADDPERVGKQIVVPAPIAFDVTAGYAGTAVWIPGEKLPKLILGPGRGKP